jgi:hypothetical protein
MELAPHQVDAPPLDFGSATFDEQIGSSASLILYLLALTLVLMYCFCEGSDCGGDTLLRILW